jgi:hypothetical protein
MVIFYRLPVSDPDTIYMGINDRDPAWHDLYKLRLSTGARELVRKNTDRLSELFFDNLLPRTSLPLPDAGYRSTALRCAAASADIDS